jgi:catechol 2,3-dioxygenase-like lactoylglutathione lyase family enzyme
MLADHKIVAFVATANFDEARAFYEGRLGLTYKSHDGFALGARCKRNHGTDSQGS